MDAASFERVYDSLQEFHAFFAASFGRKQWRDHSGNYLQALLVQDQERRNAENLSESVGISARAMQRFLTEARWSDETVIGRLQEYLAPRLGHPEAVWVFDGSDFPKQGRKSAGVARQYCGRLGKVANCQGGMFLAYVSPLGRALVDKRLYLPKSWTSDQDKDRRNYLALEIRVLELGYLRAEWVAGEVADLRRAERSPWTRLARVSRRPRKPKLPAAAECSAYELPDDNGGPGKPGAAHLLCGPPGMGRLAPEPTCPTLPRANLLWPTWVGQETETEKGDVGLLHPDNPDVPAEPAAENGHEATGWGEVRARSGLEDTQLRNERARRSHERRRSTRPDFP